MQKKKYLTTPLKSDYPTDLKFVLSTIEYIYSAMT